jgi:hypothetical protein
MNSTPRTDEQINGKPCTRFYILAGDSLRNAEVPSEFARTLERELNAANDRIKRLIAERDTARLQSDQKVSLREEFRELLGTDDIEVGVAVVREMKNRIKRLKEALDLVRPHCDSVHHSKKHQHQYGQPCPVVALIENVKEAKL